MDCLHCGRSLTFLKKWGDSRFCSAEHERAWKDSMQAAMLDRLRVTAGQFRRAVQSTRTAAAASADPQPTVEIFSAPPVAGFRVSPTEAVESGLGPLMKHLTDPAGLAIQLPSGPSFNAANARHTSKSSPLSTDASMVVPVDAALAVATQSSS
ncbi:MAG: hypothetical protein SGI92_20145 [Bryobacteraceae bacterium]|nr:hypothetical protein [Bryobacteraceae bacterium]